MKHIFLIFLFMISSMTNFAQNNSENTILFKGRVKVNALESDRTNIQNFFGETLGLNIEKHKIYDRVHFDGGGFVAFVYHKNKEMVLKKEGFINSMQVGLLIPTEEYDKVKEKIKGYGIEPMLPNDERYKDHSKYFYFHAPGGQVFRIVNTSTEEINNEKNGINLGYDSEIHKRYLIKYLELSLIDLEKSITNLNEDQWHFKPAENVWSIAQISEHISKAETSLTKRAHAILKMPLANEKNKNLNDRIMFVEDFISEKNRKTNKINVAPGTEPSTTDEVPWANPKEFLNYFKSERQKTIDFVKSTDEDLFNHFMPTIPQLGDMNSYLWLIFMSAHNSRHNAQILEVKNHKDFPF